MTPQTRTLAGSSTLDPPNRLHGYAARFNEESAVLFDPRICKGPFVEIIMPGAFARTLRERPDVPALYNHDRSSILGRTKAGTLVLAEDASGLAFDLSLPDTTVARDLRESIRLGNIDGCSFSGHMVEDELIARDGLPPLHRIYDIDLVEITPATAFPAFDTTSVALRHRSADLPDAGPSRPVLALARARFRLARD